MLKRTVITFLCILSILLASCSGEASETRGRETVLSVESYLSDLSAGDAAHLQQLGLLLHPLKDAIALYGEDYTLSWEGNYARLTFPGAKCSFESYVGAEFEHYDWYNNYIDFDDCNVMEYLSFSVIERVIFDGEGLELTDGIAIGMTAAQIAKQLKVAQISYRDSCTMITTDYDENGRLTEYYHISGQLGDLDYIVVFGDDTLSHVEIANYTGCITDGTGDGGKQVLDGALAFLRENGLATFEPEDLSLRGSRYSAHYDSWFSVWQFAKGEYEGYELHVEQSVPHRIYITDSSEGFPILFWCDGAYTDPVLSFLGKWRAHNSNQYIHIKSVSQEGIVVFDMYTEKNDMGEMILLEDLNTVINEMPNSLEGYLLAAYADDYLDGDIQLFNGEVQSGYYTYSGERYYLIDSLILDLNGSVAYLPRSLTGRIGTGTLSVHIPEEKPDYTQSATWGYMENFGRDDPNGDNILSSRQPGGASVINDYLNTVYETSGLNYAGAEYTYRYDYVFPVNNITYHVWESKDTQSPHYLYADSVNGMVIRETAFNSVSRHTKELVYKAGVLVSSRSYAEQRYVSLDGSLVVDLAGRTIHKADSFVPEIEISAVGFDTVGQSARFMFFADIGNRFALNGYVLVDQRSWGATVHITDSNISGFNIGVYYLGSETFFLDPSVGVVSVSGEQPGSQYLDDSLGDTGTETKLVIRQFGGQIVGYIYVDEQGNKTVKDFHGKILGYYYADRDVTTDFYGKILSRGDTASALLFP